MRQPDQDARCAGLPAGRVLCLGGGFILAFPYCKMAAAELVGVGEAAHGELLSWGTRLDLLKSALSRTSENVVVFVENLHPFVSAMNVRGNFLRHDERTFYPFLCADANCSRQHLRIHEELRALNSAVRFVGVDVQVTSFPDLWRQTQTGDAALDSAVRRAVERRGSGFVPGWGADRNRRNARIILDLMSAIRATTYFYWAHNAHVCLSCQESRATAGYETEGSLLRAALGARYRSVLTYAPRLWCAWGTGGARQYVLLERSERARRMFGGKLDRSGRRELRRLPRGLAVDDGMFRDGDFDLLVVSPRGPRLTLLSQSSKQRRV
jgi:hypothetical protein